MIDKIKLVGLRMLSEIKKFDSIIISLAILLVFGYALLEINDAIDPTPTPEIKSQVELLQTSSQVRFDQKAIEKIKELVYIESNVAPSKDKHSDNPFDLSPQ